MTERVMPLAGAKYQKGALERLAKLPEGTRLRLVREASNPHDPLAVAVWLPAQRGIERMKLGFVPRSDNVEIAWALASGVSLTIEFAGCDHEATPRITVRWP